MTDAERRDWELRLFREFEEALRRGLWLDGFFWTGRVGGEGVEP